MNKFVLPIIFMTVLAAAIGCKKPPAHEGCTDSGGTIIIAECCGSTGDFPNTCVVGPCGCSPAGSHEVYSCDCGAGKCFNGAICIDTTLYDEAGASETEDQGSKQGKGE